MGSHMIVSGEWANKVGEPFGVTFEECEWKHDPNNYKGPLADCAGVDVHKIARNIKTSVGAQSISFMGRGSQFRADVTAVQKVVESS
jgi:hypothetical protein